jgi:hypothetical protein
VVFISQTIRDGERNGFAILVILFIVCALAASLFQGMMQVVSKVKGNSSIGQQNPMVVNSIPLTASHTNPSTAGIAIKMTI